MADEKDTQARWYVVHTYSGYENKVRQDLETVVENRRLHDLIHEVRVPIEIESETDDKGKVRDVEHKLFPGYVFVKMVMNDDSWYVVRNARGVTGFVGPSSKPVPLSDEEVEKLGMATYKKELDFAIGESVQVVSGSFNGLIGVVESIDEKAKKVTVKLSLFGRETPTEMDFAQVKPL